MDLTGSLMNHFMAGPVKLIPNPLHMQASLAESDIGAAVDTMEFMLFSMIHILLHTLLE